jgi:ubiquinol-cytochrome c reductase cytochrome c1 subunit
MRTFIKLLTVAAILSAPAVTLAAGGSGAALDPFTPERTDRTLQRGARLFMNYCLGCHTADYHRYSHMARDIGLSEEDVLENLVFTTDDAGEKTKVGSLIASNMTADYAEEAFGVKPPNLALVSRSRGVDWLYTFMRSFYLDESRPLGANNTLYPQVGMPHVLADLQGWRKPIYTTDADGHEKLEGFQQVTAGSLTADEYDAAITDLVSFLDYLGDPNKEARHSLGIKVMLFLLVFLILAVMLKREYWKDVPH